MDRGLSNLDLHDWSDIGRRVGLLMCVADEVASTCHLLQCTSPNLALFGHGRCGRRCPFSGYSGSRISGPSGPSWTQLGHAAFAPKVSNARYTLDRQRLSDAKHSIGHLEVWPIKHISPPIITLGNRSGRSDKSKPKNRFKDHVCGPAIRPTVEWETRRLTKVRSSKSLRSLHLGTNSVSIIF